MSAPVDKRNYWESKILRWEKARYGAVSCLRPGSWTLRRRMSASAELIATGLPPALRVLELGCGSGLLAEKIESRCSSYLGIDLAEAAIARARARLPAGKMQFRRADVLEDELPASDLTIFLGVVDWLDDAELKLLFRRLRCRYLLFSFTEAKNWRGAGIYSLYRYFHDRKHGRGSYSARSFDRAELDRWLAPMRALRVEIHPTVFFDPGRLVLVELPISRGSSE